MLDTETTNSIDDPICYDIGFAVVDLTGKVYEQHSYVVADVFLDKDLMASAYFAEKIPQYWEDIKSGKRKLRKYKTIRFILRDVMAQYNIKYVVAHNAQFDYRSTNLTQRFLTSSAFRYFFPYGTQFLDTLKMAKETFGNDEKYIQYCIDNCYTYGAKNTPRFTAEILYRYLTGQEDFIESHTGLEDVMIEKDIFVECAKKMAVQKGLLWV